MNMQARIRTRLEEALSPQQLDVVDDSGSHIGHPGARPGGETHFKVRIVAEAFSGKSRVQRHRLVYDALAQELKDRVHALVIEARSPDE